MHPFLDHELLLSLSKIPLKTKRAMSGHVTGKHASPHRGSSVEFSEYRKYVAGDDLRRLDWKVLARSDRFYLKEYEADTNLRVYFVIDASGSMNFQSSDHEPKIEYARRIAASLAYLLVKQGDAAGLWVSQDQTTIEMKPSRRPTQLEPLFQALADIKLSGQTSLSQTLHHLARKVPARALIVIISDFFTELSELSVALQHLRFRQHSLRLFHLLDPQEIAFPFEQAKRFVDLENGNSLMLNPSLINQGYHQALQEFLKTLRKTAISTQADYQLVKTDAALESTLREFLLSHPPRS